jgi:hypothetical protein
MLLELKVKSPILTKNHAMKMIHWGVEVQLHPFLTLALDGAE